MDRKPTFIVSCVATILTDLLVLALPLRPIWTLKMENKTKLGLMCVFALGILVTIFSCIRLYFVINVDYYYDFTYTAADAMFFTALEPALMVMCISLPMLYTLFPKRSQKMQKSSSGQKKPRIPLSFCKLSHFSRIEESQLTNYAVCVQTKNPNREPIEVSNDSIIVQESFSVREEPARPEDMLGGPDRWLPKRYSTVAWSQERH
ncbi:hypothetical protein AAE478_009964 [Parahypoxylon ruwenzoriense]